MFLASPGERRAGVGRGHRRRHLAVPLAAARGRAAAGRPRAPSPSTATGSSSPPHDTAHRRPRRADRRGGVARRSRTDYTQGFRQNAGPRHRRRRRRHRDQRVSAATRRRPASSPATIPNTGERAVAHVDHRAPRRPERRLVGRHPALPARRRRLSGFPGSYDPRARPLLHRDGAGEAVGGGEPGHDDPAGRALHQLDAGPAPADGAGGVVLPARAGRDPRPRHRLRAGAGGRRRCAVALHHRQGRHPLEARPSHRGAGRPARDRLPGRLRVHRPDHRRADLPA